MFSVLWRMNRGGKTIGVAGKKKRLVKLFKWDKWVAWTKMTSIER